MEWEDVTLKDFYQLIDGRGTNLLVIQAGIMKQVEEIAPKLMAAYIMLKAKVRK